MNLCTHRELARNVHLLQLRTLTTTVKLLKPSLLRWHPNELITRFGNKDMSSVNVIHTADLLPPGTAPNYSIVLKDTKSCNKQQTAVRYRCAAISCYWRRGDGKKFSEHWRKTTWPAQNASIAENEIWNIWSTCKYDCACVNLFACHN